jgi:D-alanyl-D-alanine dipeptidase
MALINTHRSLLAACALPLLAIALQGCSPEADEDAEESPGISQGQELASAVSCAERRETAYTAGSPREIKVITIGGKLVSKTTGHAFLKMQRAADAAGVHLAINSGFRTMSEQRYFYNCYVTGNCNNGNLAARPGYSNHQSGTALDLTTSSWLSANAGRFGFRRTVAGEPWHYEYHGADPGGPCGGGGGASAPDTSDADAECNSQTLGKMVPEKTCVESKFDREWYQCSGGVWMSGGASGSGPVGACLTRHPLP